MRRDPLCLVLLAVIASFFACGGLTSSAPKQTAAATPPASSSTPAPATPSPTPTPTPTPAPAPAPTPTPTPPPTSPPPTAVTVSDIQKITGWDSCSACAAPGGNGTAVPYSLTQGIANPSISGSSAQFWLGGTSATPYSNALWFKRLPGSATATHFILDFYLYIANVSVAQGLEFDVFYSRDGKKNYFLTECDSRGTYAGTWQISNAVIDTWQHTGKPCKLQQNSWNHITLEFYRTSTAMTHFVSATLNGDKQTFDVEYPPQDVNSFEMNPAVQMDGDEKQDNFSIWVDNMSLTYW